MPPSRFARSAIAIGCAASCRSVAVVLAGAGGAWVGSHQSPKSIASVATPRSSVLAALPSVPAAKIAARKPAPERLLIGGALVPHTFTPKLLGAAAILVDASTGRVLWGQSAHERRRVASTTKIMTALLALREARPHDS